MCKHCWDDDPAVHHKDFIRGWADDGFEETKHKKASKKKKREKKGCPGNDGNEHVYVWQAELDGWSGRKLIHISPYSNNRWYYEYFVCCGCGQRARPSKKRRTFRMIYV